MWRSRRLVASFLAGVVMGGGIAGLWAASAAGAVAHRGVAAPMQPAPDTAAQIVDQVNAERVANRIPPVALGSILSSGCHLLDDYEHLHGDNFVHSETPGSAGYTASGDTIARSGPLLSIDGGSSVTGWGNNPYEFGPNHLFGLLNPLVSVMGADDSVFAVGGGLVEEICVTSTTSDLRPAPRTDTVYTYPGDGATIYPSETASEEPTTPGESVGIPAGATTGPYLLVFADGPFDRSAARIVRASLSGPQGPVKLDIVNRENGAGGFLIPVSALSNLVTYRAQVTFTIDGARLVHSWSFKTNSDARTASGATGAGMTETANAALEAIIFKITLYGKKAPLKVVFEINSYLPHPITGWQLTFGDGLSNQGSGNPPHFAGHTFEKPGSYHVRVTLYESGGAKATTTANLTIP